MKGFVKAACAVLALGVVLGGAGWAFGGRPLDAQNIPIMRWAGRALSNLPFGCGVYADYGWDNDDYGCAPYSDRYENENDRDYGPYYNDNGGYGRRGMMMG